MIRRLATAMLFTALSLPAGSAAQDTASTLEGVEELTRMGRTEEARAALTGWWSASYAKAPRRDVQRALWLRGRLTVDPAQARLDFQRLVVEFPGGPFSDQALLRLAQAAYAAGDSALAASTVARLGREYPASSVPRDAEVWLAAAGPVPAPTTPAPTTPAAEPASATANFAVQLGAFANRNRAEVLRRRATEAGYDARLVLVPGSDLVRVRVGTFDDKEQAGVILQRLVNQGFAATLAKDAHLEEHVGR